MLRAHTRLLIAIGLAVLIAGALGIALWTHSSPVRVTSRPTPREKLSPREVETVAQLVRAGGPQTESPASSVPGADLETSPAAELASIEGRVALPDGNPAEGTEVVLLEVEEIDALSLARAARRDEGTALRELLERHVSLADQARTAADGAFVFTRLSPAHYVVVARDRHHPSTVSHLLRLGDDNDADGLRVDLTLERGLAIEGRVIDAEGEPVSGAIIGAREVHRDRRGARTLPFLPKDTLDVVRIGERLRTRSTESEDDGSFRLRGLHPCSHGLLAKAPGNLRARAAGVDAGETDLVVRLEEGATLKGQVRFANGSPAAGVTVEVFSSRSVGEGPPRPPGLLPRESGARGETDARGSFLLTQLEPGLHVLRVRGGGVKTETIPEVRLERSRENALAITVQPGSTLRGVVVGEQGTPLVGVKVHVKSRPPRVLETGAAGRFFTDSLDPDSYWVSVAAAPPYPQNTAARRVETDQAEVVFTLRPATPVSGRILDATTGEPVDGARLTLRSPSTKHGPLNALSDAEGRFLILSGVDGSLALRAAALSYYSVSRELLLQPGVPVTGVEIGLPAATRLEGLVRTPDGEPVGAALVALGSGTAFGEAHWAGPVATTPEGTFRLFLSRPVPPGEYYLHVTHPECYLPESLRLTEVELARNLSDIEVTLAPGGSLSGTVSDLGTGVANAAVQILRCAVELSTETQLPPGMELPWLPEGEARSDHRGRFDVQGLRPGAYVLRVEADGYSPYRGEPFLVARSSRAQQTISLWGESIIAGVIRDDEGRPLADATITARSTNRAPDAVNQAWSDEAGRYRLPKLRPRRYDLRVARKGYGPEERPAVDAGNEQVDFSLSAPGAIAGTVSDLRSGLPVRDFEVRVLPDSAALRGRLGRVLPDLRERGEFRVEDLPRSPYLLMVTADGYRIHESPVLVEPGSETRVAVALDPGAAIEGSVFDTLGRPVAALALRAVRLVWKPKGSGGEDRQRELVPFRDSGADTLTRSTTTDGRGAFRLGGLADGYYRIEANHPELGKKVTAPVEVSSARDAPTPQVRVVLDPER